VVHNAPTVRYQSRSFNAAHGVRRRQHGFAFLLAVEASGLVKAFGTTRAVDGVDLAVPTGPVYGFPGPNGAGKSTTIRMLATLLRPDADTARVLGHDLARQAAAVRARVSLTGQLALVDGTSPGGRIWCCWPGCSATPGPGQGTPPSCWAPSGWPTRSARW
jgi:ABC-type multidrug transport system fused ATPase/permease subunit